MGWVEMGEEWEEKDGWKLGGRRGVEEAAWREGLNRLSSTRDFCSCRLCSRGSENFGFGFQIRKEEIEFVQENSCEGSFLNQKENVHQET